MDNSLGSLGDISADGSKQERRYSQAKGSLVLGLLPHRRITPPRHIPPEVLIQLDKLLDLAIPLMVNGKEPAILSPMMWDAILILYRTGIRCSELTHLEAPSQWEIKWQIDEQAEHITSVDRSTYFVDKAVFALSIFALFIWLPMSIL